MYVHAFCGCFLHPRPLAKAPAWLGVGDRRLGLLWHPAACHSVQCPSSVGFAEFPLAAGGPSGLLSRQPGCWNRQQTRCAAQAPGWFLEGQSLKPWCWRSRDKIRAAERKVCGAQHSEQALFSARCSAWLASPTLALFEGPWRRGSRTTLPRPLADLHPASLRGVRCLCAGLLFPLRSESTAVDILICSLDAPVRVAPFRASFCQNSLFPMHFYQTKRKPENLKQPLLPVTKEVCWKGSPPKPLKHASPPPFAFLQKDTLSFASATGRGGKLWGHQPSPRGKTFLVTESDSPSGLLGLIGIWDNSIEVCSPVSLCESGAAPFPCLSCIWLSFPLLWEVSTVSLCLRSCIYLSCWQLF